MFDDSLQTGLHGMFHFGTIIISTYIYSLHAVLTLTHIILYYYYFKMISV